MQGIVGLHEYVLGAYMHANGLHTNQYAIHAQVVKVAMCKCSESHEHCT